MMLDMGDSVEDIARKSGFSQSTVRRRMKLLELDQEKFKASVERGANLMDYMELDKSEADLTGYDRAPRQSAAAADAAKARETFRDLRGTFTAEQVLNETERGPGCGATVVDQSACVGCGVCTTKGKFDAIHLVRATDAAGKVYEKLMPESGKNLARRVKEIAVKRVARPSAK